jgi:hypothetical protein
MDVHSHAYRREREDLSVSSSAQPPPQSAPSSTDLAIKEADIHELLDGLDGALSKHQEAPNTRLPARQPIEAEVLTPGRNTFRLTDIIEGQVSWTNSQKLYLFQCI